MLKKSLSLLLCIILAAAMLAGCGGGGAEESAVYRRVYSAEASTLNYLTSGTVNDTRVSENVIDTLVEYDRYGNVVMSLAKDYTVNDDYTVWTFTLKDGLKWVNNKGEVVADITAQDWLVAAEYVLNPANSSANTRVWQDLVLNATAYVSGEITDFSLVGIKALDDKTIEYTLERPIPYFIHSLTRNGHYPAYHKQLEELGPNFALDNESMLFNGPYYLSKYAPQEERVYTRNPHYWDKEQVFIDKYVEIYNAEAITLAPEMFLRGEVDEADISTAILSSWMERADTKDIVTPSPPDISYMYYYGFNYDPQFDEEYEPDNWKLAVNNENFRQSIYWALDKLRAKSAQDPYNPDIFISNTITPATAYKDGDVDFVNIGSLAEITARTFPQKDKALEFRDKAIEELTAAGATFPIKVLMPYNPAIIDWDKEVMMVAQDLENTLGKDYIECIIQAGPSTGFLDAVRRSGKYCLMKLNNSNSVADPSGWQVAFAKGNNWTFLDRADGEETIAIREEYYRLCAEANAIIETSERYAALAEAEAFLINHALTIPFSCDTYSYMVRRINTFDLKWSPMAGHSKSLKGARLREEPVTTEEFLASYEDWKEKVTN
ncbi:MAG: ABC transporter substrate-binding protein [Bacillota bacterium]|jgi:oligopeptide transport system substrate-binding protein